MNPQPKSHFTTRVINCWRDGRKRDALVVHQPIAALGGSDKPPEMARRGKFLEYDYKAGLLQEATDINPGINFNLSAMSVLEELYGPIVVTVANWSSDNHAVLVAKVKSYLENHLNFPDISVYDQPRP